MKSSNSSQFHLIESQYFFWHLYNFIILSKLSSKSLHFAQFISMSRLFLSTIAWHTLYGLGTMLLRKMPRKGSVSIFVICPSWFSGLFIVALTLYISILTFASQFHSILDISTTKLLIKLLLLPIDLGCFTKNISRDFISVYRYRSSDENFVRSLVCIILPRASHYH